MLNSAHQGESLHLGHGDHLCKGYYFCMSRPSWPSWRTPPRWQRRCRWGRRPRTIPGPMRNSRLSREITVFWQQKKIFQSDPPGSPAAVLTPSETAAEEQTSHTLQRWFPLWGGWYDAENRGEKLEQPPEIEENIQDAIKEDNEVFGIAHKDVVFSHMSFHLRQASVKLIRSKMNCSLILSSRM